MKLGEDIIELDGRAGRVYYHKENDAVLVCSLPTDNQIDGFEDFDELIIDVTETETESWRIDHTFSKKEFLKILKKLEKIK